MRTQRLAATSSFVLDMGANGFMLDKGANGLGLSGGAAASSFGPARGSGDVSICSSAWAPLWIMSAATAVEGSGGGVGGGCWPDHTSRCECD